ncbi:hypothetical protein TGAM01_v210043 [Trichoderma gamsii]|uniref:Uncharacterized protein n=1 Tax=Trichoderma gamsii TaxID=398673 RepID=A0A2P4Z9Y6_9HYPO|nr:hypothetical protein TGAM01_v210043 [Trichoderma gamsii]PON21087.1 hypothetical protein TGAM01_v210043 [Trichoderma gamsii]
MYTLHSPAGPSQSRRATVEDPAAPFSEEEINSFRAGLDETFRMFINSLGPRPTPVTPEHMNWALQQVVEPLPDIRLTVGYTSSFIRTRRSEYQSSTSFPSKRLSEKIEQLFLDSTAKKSEANPSSQLKALPSTALDSITQSLASSFLEPFRLVGPAEIAQLMVNSLGPPPIGVNQQAWADQQLVEPFPGVFVSITRIAAPITEEETAFLNAKVAESAPLNAQTITAQPTCSQRLGVLGAIGISSARKHSWSAATAPNMSLIGAPNLPRLLELP